MYGMRIRDSAFLLLILGAGYLYTASLRYWIDSVTMRFVALFIGVMLLMVLYYFIVKPENTISFTKTLSVIVLGVVAILVVGIHIFARNDFSIKHLFVIVIAIADVCVAAFMYSVICRIKIIRR